MKLAFYALVPLALGSLYAFQVESPILKNHINALKDAKSIDITFDTRKELGAAETSHLWYSKPNFIKLETPKMILQSDGKTVWELNKADNTYTESDATKEWLMKRVQGDDILPWGAFFVEDPFKKIKTVTVGPKRVIKKNEVTEVALKGENIAFTLYIDTKTGVARGISLKPTDKPDKPETLIMASEMKISDKPIPDDTFAFTAPAGSKKVEKAANAANWAAVADILNRRCMPCHGGDRPKAGVNLASYAGVMAGRRGTPIVTAGDANSDLVQYMLGTKMPKMPPGGGVPDAEINTIKAWITAGAKNE